MRAPWANDVDILRKLARLPLQRLSFLRHHESDHSITFTPFSLEGLPRSLTELDTDLCAPIKVPFPLVWKLGVRETRYPMQTFVADATTAFPNVTQLVLRQHKVGLICIMPSIIESTRPLSKNQWRSQPREAWPSLSSIWAEDLCILYCLGLSKRISSLSVPFSRCGEERYAAPALSDTSPTSLELQVDMDDAFTTFSNDWGSHFGPSVESVRRLTMLYHTGRDHSVKWWNGDL